MHGRNGYDALALSRFFINRYRQLAIDSIANPHLNDDPGAIIAFPDETFGLLGPFYPAREKL
jgi:hypothetical protein